ncbi:hypothetical protein EBU94_01455 [bacterium]|nr:hypothetical protein [bacterium]
MITEKDITIGSKIKLINGTIFIIDGIEQNPTFGTLVCSSIQGGEKGRYRDSISEVLDFFNENNSIKLNH